MTEAKLTKFSDDSSEGDITGSVEYSHILAARNPMDIELIVRNVCEFLPTSDLLSQCSLVNSVWKSESRALLVNARLCVYRTRKDRPCSSINKLEKGLRNQTIPNFINGLAVSVNPYSHNVQRECRRWFARDVGNLVFSSLQLKYIELGWRHQCLMACPAVQLAIRYFRHRADTLEEICIGNLPRRHGLFPPTTGNPVQFPALRVLRSELPRHEVPFHVVTKIIAAAPNLKAIDIEVSYADLTTWLTPEKFGMLKNLLFKPDNVFKRIKLYEEVLKAKPRLRKITALPPLSRRPPVLARSWECLRALFQVSCATLQSVHFPIIVPIMLHHFNVDPLRNAEVVNLEVPFGESGAQLRAALTKINLNHLLPSVKRVEIKKSIWNMSHLEQMMYRKAFQQLTPNTVQNKNIFANESNQNRTVDNCGDDTPLLSPCVQLTPVTSTIDVEITCEDYYDYWTVLTTWQRPLSIHLKIPANSTVDLDALLCGLFPEEAVELRKESNLLVKSLAIVPVRPTLTELKNLRRLELSTLYPREGQPSTTAIPSKVSRILVFLRMSDIKVFLRNDAGRGTVPQHMSSFTEIDSDN